MSDTISNILEYAEMAAQKQAVRQIRKLFEDTRKEKPLAFVHSYGCQQNVADGERLQGLLAEMGYAFTDDLNAADLILYNTCAVRENAENRVYGNVGALKAYKKRKPGLVIVLTGCMTQQPAAAARFRERYPHVDIVLGVCAWNGLPGALQQKLFFGKRTIHEQTAPEDDGIVEGLPVRRDGKHKAWVSVMYGCDNFCSYCIVPYVRGRERSREPEAVLSEIRELVVAGYKEITLLGQNVNSYGKGLRKPIDFAGLLRAVDALEGDFRVRFMTSHPKDCTRELIDTVAECPKICNHIHLPVQSGSDRVLERMNRRYTAKDYLALIEYAKSRIPGLSLTSDIIVGFPGETREDFEQTLALVRQVRFASLYTFVYSRRSGTAAENFADPVPEEEKNHWLRELLDLQESIGQGVLDRQVGRVMRVLPEEIGRGGEGTLLSRSDSNFVVELDGPPEWIGRFVPVRITVSTNWSLKGEVLSGGPDQAFEGRTFEI